MNKKIILALFMFNAYLPSAQAQTITPDQLSTVIDTYRANGVRFINNFRGKKFEGQVTVAKVAEAPLADNEFIVYFDVANIESYCHHIQNKKIIKQISNFDKGQMIFINGTIEDVAFGQVILNNCKFDTQKPKS